MRRTPPKKQPRAHKLIAKYKNVQGVSPGGMHKADSAEGLLPATGQQAAVVKPGAPVAVDKSLYGQYQFVLTKVYHYQEPFISSLWRNFSDTLTNNRHKLKEAQSKLTIQSKTIDSLNAQVTSKDEAALAVSTG